MKMCTLTFLIILIFLQNPTFSYSDDTTPTPTPVRDIMHKKVTYGTKYYLMVATGRASGLNITAGFFSECPQNVIVDDDSFHGVPVIFYPADNTTVTNNTVYSSTDLNIKFDINTTCNNKSVWSMDNYGGMFVETNGVVGNYGYETIRNWFKLEAFGSDRYKIVYCPDNCYDCARTCGAVGAETSAQSRLALTKYFLTFVLFPFSPYENFDGGLRSVV